MIKYEYYFLENKLTVDHITNLIPGELYHFSIRENHVSTKKAIIASTSVEKHTLEINLDQHYINYLYQKYGQLLIFKGIFYSFDFATFEVVFIDISTNQLFMFIDMFYNFNSDVSDGLQKKFERKFRVIDPNQRKKEEQTEEKYKLIDDVILNSKIRFSSRIIQLTRII